MSMRWWTKNSNGKIRGRAVPTSGPAGMDYYLGGMSILTPQGSAMTASKGDVACDHVYVMGFLVATGTNGAGNPICVCTCSSGRTNDCDGTQFTVRFTYSGGTIDLTVTLAVTGGWVLLYDGSASNPKFKVWQYIRKYDKTAPEFAACQFAQSAQGSPASSTGPTPYPAALSLAVATFAGCTDIDGHGNPKTSCDNNGTGSNTIADDVPGEGGATSASHVFSKVISDTADLVITADSVFDYLAHNQQLSVDDGTTVAPSNLGGVSLELDPGDIVTASSFAKALKSDPVVGLSGTSWKLPNMQIRRVGVWRLKGITSNTVGYYSILNKATVTPGAPFALAFYNPASTPYPNRPGLTALSPGDLVHNQGYAVIVGIFDKYGNLCSSATNTVTLTLTAPGPTGVPPSIVGTASKPAVNGICSFSIQLKGLGYDFVLHAASTGLIGLYNDVRPAVHLDKTIPFAMDCNLKLVSAPTACSVGQSIDITYGITDANGVFFQPNTPDPLVLSNGPLNGHFTGVGNITPVTNGTVTFTGHFPSAGTFNLDLGTSFDTYALPGDDPLTPNIVVSP